MALLALAGKSLTPLQGRLIALVTYLLGKYKVAPWLHKRHEEHLAQKERHHRELIDAHKKLFELHQQQHQELLDATRRAGAPAPGVGEPIQTSPAPINPDTELEL